MKRLLVTFLAVMLVMAGATMSQTTAPEITLPLFSQPGCDTVRIPVTVKHFTGIAGLQLYTKVEGDKLQYVRYASTRISSATVGYASGVLSVIWEDINNPLNLSDGDTLFTIILLPVATPLQNSTLSFTGENGLFDSEGNTIDPVLVNGTISCGEMLPEAEVYIPHLQLESCGEVTIPVMGVGLTDLAGAQLHIQFDQTKLAFDRFETTVMQAPTINAENSQVHVVWEDINSHIDLPDSGVLINLVFDVIEPALTPIGFSFGGTNELVNPNGEPISARFSDGSATISLLAQPAIVCPSQVLDTSVCVGAGLCIPISVTNANSVTTSVGTWDDGQLCIAPVESAGLYDLTAVIAASNGCGSVRCTVQVALEVTPLPQITCPSQRLSRSLCGSSQVCVDLPITGHSQVSSSPIGTWANGVLCFQADSAGLYVIEVNASNSCGAKSCRVEVQVNIGDLPQIAGCPTEPLFAAMCAGSSYCFDLPLAITGADQVIVHGNNWQRNGTWENGRLCFEYIGGGFIYELQSVLITATNACGEDTCTIPITILEPGGPSLSCPASPIVISVCAGEEACIPLEITGYFEPLSIPGVTWKDNSICFVPDTSGTYNFHVVVKGDCYPDSCDLQAIVTVERPPVIVCPNGPIQRILSEPAEICIDLPISGGATVTGPWSAGRVCFFASESGVYEHTIIAVNRCGADTCVVSVNVSIEPIVNSQIDIADVQVTTCGRVDVPILASHFEAVAGIQLGIGFDTALLNFNTLNSKYLTNPTFNASNGVVFIVWENFLSPISISNTDTLAVLQFAAIQAFPSPSAITCAGPNELVDDEGNPFVFDCSPGSAQVDLLDFPIVGCPESTIVISGCLPQEICLEVPVAPVGVQIRVIGATWNNGSICFEATTPGLTNITVIASNDCGADTCQYVFDILEPAAPTACFEVSPDRGPIPLTVEFSNCSDASDNAQYIYTFGDGTSSTLQNPYHTYEYSGIFPVSLTVEELCGADIHVDTVYAFDSVIIVPTDQWINLYCQNPTLDGIPLEVGDTITVYDPQGVLCGMGLVQPDGHYGFVPVYRDDSTSNADEGADPGDQLNFKINCELALTESPIIWTGNGDRIQTCQFTSQRQVNIPLHEGWNLVSWNVAYAGSINEAIAGIRDCIDVVLGFDRGGRTYDPDLERFSTLTQVDNLHGYWIKVHPGCETTLQVTGLPLGNVIIPIYRGWNLVSYLPEDSLTPPDALVSIYDNLQIVYTFEDGTKVFSPGSPAFNTLEYMKPTQGYWIKSSANDQLVYPGFGDVNSTAGRFTELDEISPSSRDWISVYGERLTLGSQPVANGSTITFHSSFGIECGRGVYSNGILSFTAIYGQDPKDAATEYYPAPGDDVSVRVNGAPTGLSFKWTTSGDRLQLSSLGNVTQTIPQSYVLYQNYPNPFNPSTEIAFELPSASIITLEVFNVSGQRVATLLSGACEAGHHAIRWDGTDFAGNSVSSGIYWYRLQAGDFRTAKKMLLVK